MGKLISFSYAIVIGIAIHSCAADPDPEIEIETDNTIKMDVCLEPFLFQPGSYWIFENDSTGSLDSISVISTENDTYWNPPPIHGEEGTKHEYYIINLKNFSTDKTYNNYLDHNFIRRNGGGSYGELGQPIFICSEEIGDGFNGMEIVEIIPVLIINRKTYKNIYVVKISAANQYQQEFEFDTYLYFSDLFGIIKKQIVKSDEMTESWSLKRWNINL